MKIWIIDICDFWFKMHDMDTKSTEFVEKNYSLKQVIVMRADLNMRKGKMIAQGCHASMAFMSKLIENKHSPTTVQQDWLDSSYTKICVRVDSEEQLMDVYERAQDAGLEVHLITDSGRTEFHGVPTKTCLAIGPDYSEKIDLITKELKLL